MSDKKIRVLFVEDDYIDREVAKRYIRRKHPGYDLRIAKTEGEAIELLGEAAYDVVVLNYEVGKEGGREILTRLGATPLIIITDRGGERVAVEAMRWGARDLLIKDQDRNYLDVLPLSIRNVLKCGRVETELTASRGEFDAIVKMLPHIIYKLNTEGRITFISDAVKLYGRKPETLVGSCIFDLVHVDDKEKAKYRVNERRTGDRSTKSLELRLTPSKKNNPPPDLFSISAEGLYNSEKPNSEAFIGTRGVALDVTREKQAQKERIHYKKLQETLGDIRSVCNELNQPLQAILGYSDLLSADSIDVEELPEVIDTIIEQARRMDKLIKKLRKTAIHETRDYTDAKALYINN
ncbi:MAG: response regulator [Desulfobacterales bacterium]|nr:response regulator [Desulfobacterales bacterium]